jgi:hypothetical protein
LQIAPSSEQTQISHPAFAESVSIEPLAKFVNDKKTEIPSQSKDQLLPKQEKENWQRDLQQITDHFVIKKFIPEAANFLSIFGNAASAIAHRYNFSDTVKSFADSFGKFGTKAFLILNGAINMLEYLLKFDLLGAFGHFNDIVVGFFVPQDHTYLDRGTASGTYTLANSLSIINGDDKFKSVGDHFKHILEGLKKTYHNFVSKEIFTNLADSNNAMIGVIASIMTNVGALTWLVTGKEKFATALRDLGGIMIDFEQAHPGHLKNGKKFYFASGLGLIGGTVFDFLSKMLPSHRDTFVPLSLCIDGIGRYLLRMSHNAGELKKPLPELSL